MILSIPLLALMLLGVYIAYRHTGLKIWHALICLVLGFLLASTAAAPEITSLITGVIHWAQAQMSGGAGDAR